MNKTYLLTKLAPVMIAISAGALAATVQWSDGDGNNGTFNNATWANLQTAIQNAENNPSTLGYVKVAGNLQRVQNDPTTGDLRIRQGGLEMSGGWNDDFTAQIGKSVLDVNASSTYTNRVFTISGTNVVVRDFVVTKGGLRGSGTGLRGYGAGIFVTGPNVRLESLIVTNNVRYDNYVTGGGIAIYGNNAYNVTVSRCKVVNNTARNAGGILVAQNAGRYGRPVVIEYCDILDNVLSTSSGSSGAGLYLGESVDSTYIRVLIANCRVRGNKADAGAVYAGCFVPDARIIFFGCDIESNRQVNTGSGAIGLRNGNNSSAYVANCTIADNINSSTSGIYGVYMSRGTWTATSKLQFINSIIVNNDGLHCDGYHDQGGQQSVTHMYFQRCTIWENAYREREYVSGEAKYYIFVTNSLVGALAPGTNNPPHHVPPLYFTGSPRYSPYFHSLTDGGVSSTNLEGNVEALPLFVGSGSDKYQLKDGDTTSIDNGLTRAGAGYTYVDINYNGSYDAYLDIVVAGTPPGSDHFYYPTDLLGNRRILQGGIDRGAYEFTPPQGTVVIIK
ncbi:MAG: hypothetical protein ACUVWX_09635 [Kiritimatiellia bacterium]